MKNIAYLKELLLFLSLYLFMFLSMLIDFFIEFYSHTTSDVNNMEVFEFFIAYKALLAAFIFTIIIYLIVKIIKNVYFSKKINKFIKIIVITFFIFTIIFSYISGISIVYSLT